MFYDPSSRNISLTSVDLEDSALHDGWLLAVEDGVAITEVVRLGKKYKVCEVPADLAEGYFSPELVKLAQRQGNLAIEGDSEYSWGGWSSTLGGDRDEW